LLTIPARWVESRSLSAQVRLSHRRSALAAGDRVEETLTKSIRACSADAAAKLPFSPGFEINDVRRRFRRRAGTGSADRRLSLLSTAAVAIAAAATYRIDPPSIAKMAQTSGVCGGPFPRARRVREAGAENASLNGTALATKIPGD
jgi:hypothetical protein